MITATSETSPSNSTRLTQLLIGPPARKPGSNQSAQISNRCFNETSKTQKGVFRFGRSPDRAKAIDRRSHDRFSPAQDPSFRPAHSQSTQTHIVISGNQMRFYRIFRAFSSSYPPSQAPPQPELLYTCSHSATNLRGKSCGPNLTSSQQRKIPKRWNRSLTEY